MDSLTISEKPKWSTYDLSALNPCAPSYIPNSLNLDMTSNLDPRAKLFTLNRSIVETWERPDQNCGEKSSPDDSVSVLDLTPSILRGRFGFDNTKNIFQQCL